MFKLKKGESVVTAWGEGFAGPGWANHPVLVLVRDPSGRLRIEYLQPEEHTSEIYVLLGVSTAAHMAMSREVERVIKKRKGT